MVDTSDLRWLAARVKGEAYRLALQQAADEIDQLRSDLAAARAVRDQVRALVS